MNNYKQKGDVLEVTVDSPLVPTSGVPCRWGNLCGIATLAESAGGVTTGNTMVDFSGGVYNLNVTSSGAIAVGDELWFHDANPPVINNVSTSGYAFGVSRGVIASGAAYIDVLHIPRHGTGTTPADTTVTTAKLVANNVTAAKLTATMRTGFVPLDIATVHLLNTNDIYSVSEAYFPDNNTNPALKRVNAGTDKNLRLVWAVSNSDEITFAPFAYPPDLDDTAAVTVHLLAAMEGAVDTPVLTVGYWEIGGANVGSATAAVTGTSVAEYICTVAAGSVSPAPMAATITVIPGAHTTSGHALYVYAAWVEYTRV
jgi:hypothetical protein